MPGSAARHALFCFATGGLPAKVSATVLAVGDFGIS
jgi:hypothetical protein